MRQLRFLVAVLILLAMTAAHAALAPVPPLTGHVVDQAGMLDEAQRARLEAVLTDYEAKTGSQIAVLLVKSTEPEAIEQFSIRVVEAWKLGRKGVDDGVLLMVARDNPPALRRLRIEAGRGVQGVLTDAQSKRILQDVIAPHFKQEQYYDGLVAGVGAIATLLNQEQFPAPPGQQRQQPQQVSSDGGGIPFPLILLGIFIAFSLFRPRRRNALGRNGWGSGMTGFIIGNALGSLGRGGGGGGFGGGGGGGFGGGGGTFDGGGASGDW